MYGLTAIKLAGGEETPRFEAKITCEGKIVGVVSNGGTGGSCSYWFAGGAAGYNALRDWAATHHPADFEATDRWVYSQLDAHEERKILVRTSKRHTVYRLDGDPGGTVRKLKDVRYRAGSPAQVWLRDKHAGGATVFDPAAQQWVPVI